MKGRDPEPTCPAALHTIAVTVVLWIIGLALHIGIDLVLRRTTTAADQLGSVSLLLYLAVTVAAQRWVVTGKAAHLTAANRAR
ncbi:MAG: hypothetical protein QOI50_595 [Pseudonocardiales bacterium]|jgi:hypothetical protein|nr:hypothetical protein [Pseudonocardiales bacterium]